MSPIIGDLYVGLSRLSFCQSKLFFSVTILRKSAYTVLAVYFRLQLATCSCQTTTEDRYLYLWTELMRLRGQITSAQADTTYFFKAVRQLTTELMRQVTVPAWVTFLAVRQLTTELMRASHCTNWCHTHWLDRFSESILVL